MKAAMIRYAHDFIVLCCTGQGNGMQRRPRSLLERRGHKPSEKKTRVVEFEKYWLEF